MEALSSHEIRRRFVEFFEKNDHLKIPGTSVVPLNDPTLLFINSGMAPLKPYFLGTKKPPSVRLTNVQPCIRTIDIDDVGDRHHLTYFDMLGSWSIGDYYKKKAVELAYDLLINHLNFDKSKLYVTVYSGDKKLGLDPDNESKEAWKSLGFADDRIIACGEDNFWGPAGETGPCGPCTEVFYDCGPEFGPEHIPGTEFDTTSRYIEIWNAGVFMELNKTGPGQYESLPIKCVDTGSGLERMTMIMNDCDSVYDIDLFQPVFAAIDKIDPNQQISERGRRIIADHSRAACLMIGQGADPSNEGRGYIPRRLIRRSIAILEGCGLKPDGFYEVTEAARKSLVSFYDVLQTRESHIQNTFKREINDYKPVIKKGMKLLSEMLKENPNELSPKQAFELVATHGLPIELIEAYLEKQKIKFDQKGFEKEFEAHKKISKVGLRGSAAESGIKFDKSKFVDTKATDFSGYSSTHEANVKVTNLIQDNKDVQSVDSGSFMMLTDRSCFYGESGGQVGDQGIASNEQCNIQILDTQKAGDTIIHLCKIESGSIKAGDSLQLKINQNRRELIKRNHSATHLLHGVLQRVLGEHVSQKGSLVDEHKLRFDFQHPKAVSQEELLNIEKQVNALIFKNIESSVHNTDYDSAIAGGVTALFGEKYGDEVRVVGFGDSSKELCGGTHVQNTNEIGVFAIKSEASVAKGVRRIEALTSKEAYAYLQHRSEILSNIQLELKSPADKVLDSIQKIKTKAQAKPKKSGSAVLDSFKRITEVKELLVGSFSGEKGEFKSCADTLLQKHPAVCLLSENGEQVTVLIASQKEHSKSYDAKLILAGLLENFKGRGGGKPSFAQGGLEAANTQSVVKTIQKIL